jgi:hypothetical protein
MKAMKAPPVPRPGKVGGKVTRLMEFDNGARQLDELMKALHPGGRRLPGNGGGDPASGRK